MYMKHIRNISMEVNCKLYTRSICAPPSEQEMTTSSLINMQCPISNISTDTARRLCISWFFIAYMIKHQRRQNRVSLGFRNEIMRFKLMVPNIHVKYDYCVIAVKIIISHNGFVDFLMCILLSETLKQWRKNMLKYI